MSDEDVAQRSQRQNVNVVQRLHRRRLVGVRGKRVPDRSASGDVRKRERLVTERERGDVVPARQILSAYQRASSWSKDTADFLHEVVETPDMLDHLIGVHEVERVALEWPPVVEISSTSVEPARASKLSTGGNDLQRVNVPRGDAQPPAQLLSPRTVVAAEIQEPSGRVTRGKSFQKPRAVSRSSVSPQSSHQLEREAHHENDTNSTRGRARRTMQEASLGGR